VVEAAAVVVDGGAELVLEDEETVELTEDVGRAVEVGSGRAVVVAGWIVVAGAVVTGAIVVEATGRLVVIGTDVVTGTGSGASPSDVVARQPMKPMIVAIAAAAAPNIQGESEVLCGCSAT